MALGQIPPWLDVKPSDFTQASEEGARLGLQQADQRQQGQLERERIAAQYAEMGQRASESFQQQQLEQERISGELADQKARTDLATSVAARKAQAQLAYQHAIQTGVDPILAMQQFGPQMGTSLTGLGTLGLDLLRTKQASIPPQMIPGPDGTKPAGYTYRDRFYPTPAKVAPKVVGLGAKARLAAATKAVETAVTPEQIKAAQANLDKIADEIDNPKEDESSPGTAETPEAQIPSMFIGTPGEPNQAPPMTATGRPAMPGAMTAQPVPSYTYDPKTRSFSTNSASQ